MSLRVLILMVAAIGSSFGELSEEHAVINEPHQKSEKAPPAPPTPPTPPTPPAQNESSESHHKSEETHTDPELVNQTHPVVGDHDHQPHIGQNESIPESVVEQENSLSEENNSSFHDQNHDDHQEHDPEHDPHYPEEFTDSIAYSRTIPVPIDLVKSLLQFDRIHALVEFIPDAVDVEVTDGNNIGSQRKFTFKKDGLVDVETKIGEGPDHFTYGCEEDNHFYPFSFSSYRVTVHMIDVGESQTLVSFTGTFLSSNPDAAKHEILPMYEGIMDGVVQLAIEPRQGSIAYSKIIDVPVDIVKDYLQFDNIEHLLPYQGIHPEDVQIEITDGNHLGSQRKFTYVDNEHVDVETKLGEGPHHFTYGFEEDNHFYPFSFSSYRATVHMIELNETPPQTLVSFTGTFFSDDVQLAHDTLVPTYAALVEGVEALAQTAVYDHHHGGEL